MVGESIGPPGKVDPFVGLIPREEIVGDFFTGEQPPYEIISRIVHRIVNITNGFPAKDQQQLFEITQILNSYGVLNMPIIGVLEKGDDGAQVVKTYMLFESGLSYEEQHQKLLERLGNPEDIVFTTSMDFPRYYEKGMIVHDHYLRLPNIYTYSRPLDLKLLFSRSEIECDVFLPFGRAGETVSPTGLPALTLEGRQIMKGIFERVAGVDTSKLYIFSN